MCGAKWNEKSDLWSIACVIIELYSGNLLFDTHNTHEHLMMIEKVSNSKNNNFRTFSNLNDR